MKILLVGAGSVGKVYGRYLSLGGAEISFFVKEKHRKAAEAGFDFYVLNQRRRRHRPQHFNQFCVITDLTEVKREKWDYVILCMDSTGLKGTWLDALLAVVPSAGILSLQPGLKDRDTLLTKISADRLLSGTIPILSFEAPLHGETLPKPGTAYWIPPRAKAAFSGSSEILGPLLTIFKKGGFPVQAVADVAHENLVASPALAVLVQALKNCGWSFSKFKKSSQLNLASSAIREAVLANANNLSIQAPPTWHLRACFLKTLLTLAPLGVPFDLERYFQVHFTKVGKQMTEALKDYEELARAQHLPNDSLKKLRPLV